MEDPQFWDDQNKAKEVSKKAEEFRSELIRWEEIEGQVDELLEISKMAQKELDESVHDDVLKKLDMLWKKFEDLEFYVLFSGTHDKHNAVVAIHAGAGGVEAQDWTEMLSRMIMRYAENKDFEVRVIDESRGSEAGIKSLTFFVSGMYAYGYLQSEAGVHRLVRISPFDAEKMRHTSFALIEVLPEISEAHDTEIKEEDLKIDTFRSGGHGGQSVNTTDSAVRVTHIPTGIVVKCQNERSQHQNKETAMKYLKSKLIKHEEAKTEEEKKKLRGEFSSAEWGNQIRSYVLQPYKMVKDHRTGHEEQDPTKVLDGELDGFVENYLRWNSSRNKERGN
jgi:peptide chain release factor 2